MKADVTTKMQRSPRSVSYSENHYSSESKRSLKKPGSEVSFLRQSSDSPTFLTAPTTEANPAPGRPDPPHFIVPSKSRAKSSRGWRCIGAERTGPNLLQKGALLQ